MGAPESCLYERNLAFLRDHASEETIDAITGADGPTPVAVETVSMPGGGTQLGFYAQSPEGRRVALHSTRDPRHEAERQLQRWTTQEKHVSDGRVVVFGLGGKHHIDVLWEWLEPGATMTVVDVHPQAVRHVLEHVDLTDLQGKEVQLRFIVRKERTDIWSEYAKNGLTDVDSPPAYFRHPGIDRAFAADYSALVQMFYWRTRIHYMNWLTYAAFSRTWVTNSLVNLPDILQTPDVRHLKDRFEGMPAVVVAAGPSLDQCIELVRELSQRAIVICVGTALRTLARHGIRPHFAVAVDGYCADYFAQFRCIDNDFHRDVFLLTPPVITPPTVALYRGRAFAFVLSSTLEINAWLTELGAVPDKLAGAGTVTLTALHAACYLGCSPVMVFGFDLCFTDEGQVHAASSTVPSDHSLAARGPIDVQGNWRPTVKTNRVFASYVKIAGELIPGLKVRAEGEGEADFINVNSDGAAIPNLPARRPEDVTPSDWPVRTDTRARIRACHESASRPDSANLQVAWARMDRDLRYFASNTRKARKACEILRDDDRVRDHPAANANLAILEERMGRPDTASLLVQALLRSGEIETSFWNISSEDDEEKLSRLNERSAIMYGHMEAAATDIRSRLHQLGAELFPATPGIGRC